MKAALLILFAVGTMLFGLGSCSSQADLAVTQTGNPTKISILIRPDTLHSSTDTALVKRQASGLIITSAAIVIEEFEVESEDEKDSILFREEHPYVVQLIPQAKFEITDTAFFTGANNYGTIELEFGPAGFLAESVDSIDPLLTTNSIVIKGYINNTPQDTFTFVSDIEGEFAYSITSSTTLQNTNDIRFLITIKIYEWFIDQSGTLIDPRLENNKELIENTIISSIHAKEEDTDEQENSEIDPEVIGEPESPEM